MRHSGSQENDKSQHIILKLCNGSHTSWKPSGNSPTTSMELGVIQFPGNLHYKESSQLYWESRRERGCRRTKKDLLIALNAISMQDRNNFIRLFSAVGARQGRGG